MTEGRSDHDLMLTLTSSLGAHSRPKFLLGSGRHSHREATGGPGP